MESSNIVVHDDGSNCDLFVTSAMLVFARNSNLAPYIIFDGSDYFVQFRAT